MRVDECLLPHELQSDKDLPQMHPRRSRKAERSSLSTTVSLIQSDRKLDTLPILLAAAQITYRFVELPGIAAGRRIAARVNTLGKGVPSPFASLEPKR